MTEPAPEPEAQATDPAPQAAAVPAPPALIVFGAEDDALVCIDDTCLPADTAAAINAAGAKP